MSNEFLLQPKSSLFTLVKDSRVWAGAVGAIAENIVEKLIFTNARQAFGFSREVSGTVIVVAPGYENANVSVTANRPDLIANRQFARFALMALSVYGIKAVADMPGDNGANAQYFLFGMATTAAAHIAQDLIPGLNMPARK